MTWLKITQVGHGRPGVWLQKGCIPPAYIHEQDQFMAWNKPETLQPRPDWVLAVSLGGGGHFFQHWGESVVRVYSQTFIFVSPLVCFGWREPLDPICLFLIMYHKYLLIWLCKNVQMRLIYFLSPPFLLSHEMIPALVHLASLKMESVGTLKSTGMLTEEIISFLLKFSLSTVHLSLEIRMESVCHGGR